MSEVQYRAVTVTLLGKLAVTLAVLLSIFQIWQPLAGFFPPGALPFESVLGLLPATLFRPVHLTWVLLLGLILYPGPLRWLDYLLRPT